ncbi:hypothetical protein A0J61_11094 [Choanephora cucurbitarum]|uniref:Uncharacterized protein n=1 Tax=Choanephora cucurbitarum TaxID=101091 RepID=A0A1C7MVR6_9FUNG|nr:hypothetical protein A0J61_11094 [Choanephora cucurbitarum]
MFIPQEYEIAMPKIVDTSKDLANRIGMVHNKLIRGQQKQEEELRAIKEKLNDQDAYNNSFNSLMHQIIKDQQMLMIQQQCLTQSSRSYWRSTQLLTWPSHHLQTSSHLLMSLPLRLL